MDAAAGEVDLSDPAVQHGVTVRVAGQAPLRPQGGMQLVRCLLGAADGELHPSAERVRQGGQARVGAVAGGRGRVGGSDQGLVVVAEVGQGGSFAGAEDCRDRRVTALGGA